MILSHKYKFIFLKTNKTAGTSVEIALSKFCGEDDIITPIVREDEKIRKRLGYRGPQNYLAPISDYGFGCLVKSIVKRERKRRFYNHMPAQEVRKYVGEDVWNSYYKFCIERNPWERVISLYYWRFKRQPRPTVAEFLETDIPLLLKRRGFELYTIDGEIAVNRVCLFENLKEGLEEIRVQLGIPEQLDLPRSKSSHRKDTRSYRDIMNEEQKQKVAALFSKEMDLFGYRP